MIYLDSNLFLYAVLYSDDKGKKAALFIKSVREGKEKVYTSALTFDEVVWGVKRHRGIDDALIAGETLLNMRNLEIVDIDREILWLSHSLMHKYSLDPRDAIHAACCIKKGVTTIISEDPDFDKVQELKRRWIF